MNFAAFICEVQGYKYPLIISDCDLFIKYVMDQDSPTHIAFFEHL